MSSEEVSEDSEYTSEEEEVVKPVAKPVVRAVAKPAPAVTTQKVEPKKAAVPAKPVEESDEEEGSEYETDEEEPAKPVAKPVAKPAAAVKAAGPTPAKTTPAPAPAPVKAAPVKAAPAKVETKAATKTETKPTETAKPAAKSVQKPKTKTTESADGDDLELSSGPAKKAFSAEKSYKEKQRRFEEISELERGRLDKFTTQRDYITKRFNSVDNYFAGFFKELKWFQDYFGKVVNNYNKMSDFHSQMSSAICQQDPESLNDDAFKDIILPTSSLHKKTSSACKDFSAKIKSFLESDIKPLLSSYKTFIDDVSGKEYTLGRSMDNANKKCVSLFAELNTCYEHIKIARQEGRPTSRDFFLDEASYLCSLKVLTDLQETVPDIFEQIRTTVQEAEESRVKVLQNCLKTYYDALQEFTSYSNEDIPQLQEPIDVLKYETDYDKLMKELEELPKSFPDDLQKNIGVPFVETIPPILDSPFIVKTGKLGMQSMGQWNLYHAILSQDNHLMLYPIYDKDLISSLHENCAVCTHHIRLDMSAIEKSEKIEEGTFLVIEKIPKIKGMWLTTTKYVLKAGSTDDMESWIEIIEDINANKQKSVVV